MSSTNPSTTSNSTALHPRPVRDLYPPITPYSQGFLSVDATHDLYWEQSGNPDGVPVLVLHGGPGAGATPQHRRFFDPSHYRIIIFDQRGAGRSHPLGCLENNTLQNLVTDIVKLREHFNIKRWHLFGGSWGSTLALAYAQHEPRACISLILRGIFLMEQAEIDWFMHGMRLVFPEAWDAFTKGRDIENLLKDYHAALTGDDDEQAVKAGLQWSGYETTCSSFLPRLDTIVSDEQRFYALAMAKIEAHYFATQVITPENSLLNNIDIVRHIPASIIQGRYDIVCPIATAHRLHQAWLEADYVIVPDAGHSFLDPSLRTRLIEATDNVKNLR
jgi:proline iminopeptidase